jgi:putative pyridoxal-dependent aspartate 1-decarboxylase
MTPPPKRLVADWQALMRTFIRPEDDQTHQTLLKYMEQILFRLHDFLKTHVGITEETSLKELGRQFTTTRLCATPVKKLEDVITDLIVDIAPRAVNVHSPYFVGHMTSAIPFFMVHLKSIVAALNQNVVKLETSKVVSVVEKQLLAKIHRLIYGKDDAFYGRHVQNPDTCLGSFTENGTMANITAFWVARNQALKPRQDFAGVEADGIGAAYEAYGIKRCVILVSRRGHYSLRKSAGLLGIGNKNLVAIDTAPDDRIDLDHLKSTIETFQNPSQQTLILAVVGIAGATETGVVDPLSEMAQICAQKQIHFHVDAAWGGPTLMSRKYRALLSGIEKADSVTIDGHKQFYMPMTCGMVYFKSPHIMDAVTYHANYINRMGSVDLGIKSLSGSREANSLILDSALKIMGTQGYALLIEHGIETAQKFAAEIEKRPDFQLITPPTLNILTYRLFPKGLRPAATASEIGQSQGLTKQLNHINRTIQRLQREAGKSFVSRTTLTLSGKDVNNVMVLRSVIMNPMTDLAILNEVLDEQLVIYQTHFDQATGKEK